MRRGYTTQEHTTRKPCTQTHTHTCTEARIHTCTCTHMHTCAHAHLHIHTRTFTSTLSSTFTHTHKQTLTHTDTCRQTDIPTYTHTHSAEVCVTKRGSYRGARHGKTDDQRGYHQAKVSLRKGKNNNVKSILERFPKQDTHRDGWTEDTCRQLDQTAKKKTSLTLPLGARDNDTKTTGSWL